jgi:hypothetical protein
MIRVVFDNDIVPNIPSMLLGYNHGDCDCLHLKEDGTFTFTNKDTNWVMELIRRIVKLFSFDIGIHDDVQHYIDKLEMIDVDSEHFDQRPNTSSQIEHTCKRSHSLTFYILRSFYASRLQDLFDVTQLSLVTTSKCSMFARTVGEF